MGLKLPQSKDNRPKRNQPELFLPIYKTPLGRPKKLQTREVDEYVSHSKLSKKNIMMKGSRCNQYGHNIEVLEKGMRARKVWYHLQIFFKFFNGYNTE